MLLSVAAEEEVNEEDVLAEDTEVDIISVYRCSPECCGINVKTLS